MFIPWLRVLRGLCASALFVFLVAHTAGTLKAQPPAEGLAWSASRPEDLTIKLVTFGPGDDIYNYFGHNGMIVQDSATGEAGLYNFGMFHFGADMLPNYMKGRLTFWVAETAVRPTFAHYRDAERSIRVQELNLSPEQRQFVAHALAVNALPKNRSYLYHHYFDNCSTRLRDLIDRAVSGQFKRALQSPARMSYRDHTRRYAEKDAITDFGLVFWMNDQMEMPIKQWDELFLPEELEQQVGKLQYVDASGKRVPLVAASYHVYDAPRVAAPAQPDRRWPWNVLLGTGLGLWAFVCARWLSRRGSVWAARLLGLHHALFGLSFGLLGTLGFLMWTLTEHTVTYRNENQLLANPITFLLLPLGLAISFGSQRALRWARVCFYLLAAGSLALPLLKLLPSFDQHVVLPLSLLLPANLGGALAHFELARRNAPARSSVATDNTAVSRA